MLYLLLVLCAPMVLLATSARAEEQEPLKDKQVSGPGKLQHYSKTNAFDLQRLTNASLVIGIDLGTTYSCVGIMKGGKVEILVNDQGNRITPSYVAFTDEERLVGDAAKNQYAANPHRTIFDIKRLIGRKFADKDVQSDMKHFPFKVVDKNGQPRVDVEVSGYVYGLPSFASHLC